MTEKEVIQALNDCKSKIAVCKTGFVKQSYDEFFFIMSVSSELFLGICERDFQLDGYTVRRIKDVNTVEPIRGTYLKIHQSEGNLSRLSMPPIDVKDWKNVIRSVIASSENVIIEGNVPDSEERFFFIGRALAAGEQGFRFRSFDGGGNWSDKTITVPYTSLASLTFGSSYVSTYSKYVKPYPEIVNPKPIINR
jgi:hypothetical protein